MIKKAFGIFLVIALTVFLSGCKSSEEKLLDACVNKLENGLEKYASYDGWSIDKIQARLIEMEPDFEYNYKYETDMFYNYEVILHDFTVKNGFNADVKSFSTCTGMVAKNSKGEYTPPDELLISVTLNGKKLGYY